MSAYVFFVSGLPRSRTAWLANWFTTDASICWHDRPFDRSLVESSHKPFVGFSGPELVVQFDEIRKHFPISPWLMILREEAQALASFREFAGDLLPQDDIVEKFWRQRCHTVSLICSHSNVVTYSFDDLESEAKCQEIWLRMLPDIEFDSERWNLLNDLQVQQDLNKNLKKWPSLQSPQSPPS